MPLLRKNEYRYQFNQFTMWQYVYKLLDKNDPLRDKVSDRYELESEIDKIETADKVFTGSAKVTDIHGKTHKIKSSVLATNEMDIELASKDSFLLNTDDSGYIKYQKKGMELVNEIRAKYNTPEQEGKHGMLNVFLDMIENNITSVTGEHRGFENTPGIALMQDERKMLDVILNDKKGWGDWKEYANEPDVYEKACKDFGLTQFYSHYNNVGKHNILWSDEINKDKPDPEKLREIMELYEQDYKAMSEDVRNFEEKFNEDMKLPEEQRQIYNIAHSGEVNSGELIGKNGGRGINNFWFNDTTAAFRTICQNQILGAELKNAVKDLPEDAESELAQKINTFMVNLMADKENQHTRFQPSKDEPAYISDKDRLDKIFEFQDYAGKHPEDPLSAKVLAICGKQLTDKHNLDCLTYIEEVERYNEAPKSDDEIWLDQYKLQGEHIDDFGKLAAEMINSIREESSFFQRDYDTRELAGGEEKMSKSYKTLVKAIKQLDKASGANYGSLGTCGSIRPNKTMDALENLINAADAYYEEHNVYNKGAVGSGKKRFNKSGDIYNKLTSKIKGLRELYKKLPDPQKLAQKDIGANVILSVEPTIDAEKAYIKKITQKLTYDINKAKENEPAADHSKDIQDRINEITQAVKEKVPGENAAKQDPNAKYEKVVVGNANSLGDQKERMLDLAAKMLAVKMAALTIKNAREELNENEIESLLDYETINENAMMIAESRAFEKMANSIHGWSDLEKLKDLTINENGGGLIEKYSGFKRQVQREDSIKAEAALKKEIQTKAELGANDPTNAITN